MLALLSCVGISAAYELIEWIAAEIGGESAEAFLATRGEVWDTQKDMGLARAGSVTALIGLRRTHDRQLHAMP